jgi:hypothetical protein
MAERLRGRDLPEGWLDLDAEATAALAVLVGIDLSVAREGPLDARQIRMLLLAEMTAEFAAENALRKIAVSRRWRVFSDDELEALEQAFGSYDPTEPLYTEVLAEIERRAGVATAGVVSA